MKAQISAILVLALFAINASALQCYQCTYQTSYPYDGDESCKNADDDIDAAFLMDCDADDVACYSSYDKDIDDVKFYDKGCLNAEEMATLYNDEDDLCEEWSVFGVDHTRCICTGEGCNGAGTIKMSLFVLGASAVMKQLL